LVNRMNTVHSSLQSSAVSPWLNQHCGLEDRDERSACRQTRSLLLVRPPRPLLNSIVFMSSAATAVGDGDRLRLQWTFRYLFPCPPSGRRNDWRTQSHSFLLLTVGLSLLPLMIHPSYSTRVPGREAAFTLSYTVRPSQ
jgi:hypothetical protein